MERVLVIEDEEQVRKEIIGKIKQVNSELIVNEADTVKSACELINKFVFDAFFVDIELTDGSGLDLAKRIRQIKKYYMTPIIFITGMVSKKMEAFEETQCYSFLIKPVDDEKIKAVMKRTIPSCNNIDEKSIDIKLCNHGVYRLIKSKDLLYVDLHNRKINLHFVNKRYPEEYKTMSIKQFVKCLPENFVKISQSIIINTNYFEDYDKKLNTVKLKNSEELLPVSRQYVKKLGGR